MNTTTIELYYIRNVNEINSKLDEWSKVTLFQTKDKKLTGIEDTRRAGTKRRALTLMLHHHQQSTNKRKIPNSLALHY
jgi:hypothetical protein